MRSARLSPRAILTAAALAVVTPSVLAQTTTWNGDSSTLWTDSANWDNGVPSSGSISLFNGAGNGNTSISLSGGSQSLGTIVFDSSSVAAYTLGNAGLGDQFNIDPNGGIAVTSTVAANQTIGAAIKLNGNGTFINSSASGSLLLGAASAPGTITLANGGVATFNAATSGASVVINDVIVDPSVGLGTVALKGVSGGIIQINSLNTYSGTTAFNGATGSLVRFNHDFNAGDPSGPFGTGTMYFNNTANNQLQPVGGDRILANPLALNFGFVISTDPDEAAHSLTFTGPITETSLGRTLTNSLASGATLTLGSSSNPSTITLPPSNSQGTTIAGTGATVIYDSIQDGAGTIDNVTVSSTGPITFNGAITSNGNFTISGANPFVIFNAARTSSGTLTVSGAATVEFNVQNTSTGTTVLSGAAANILLNASSNVSGTAGPFGTGTVVFNNSTPPIMIPIGADRTISNPILFSSGMFAANAAATIDNTGPHSLTLSGPLSLPAGKVMTNNLLGAALNFGSAASPSTFAMGGIITLQSQAGLGNNLIINDAISGTGGGFKIQNNAKLTLTNANSFTGGITVITSAGSGLLYVNNSSGSGTGTGAVTVTGNGSGAGTGGTLGGTGTMAGLVTISSTTGTSQGGIITPGPDTGGPATLTAGSMAWNPNGRYIFEYNASNTTTGGGVNDLIKGSVISGSTGALNLSGLSGGAQFDLNLKPIAGAPSATPQTYVIATFDGGVGIANGTDISNLFTYSGLFGSTPTVTVADAGSGAQSLDLSFAPVPEPGTLLLGSLGAIGLALRPRRRRSA